MNWSAVLFAEMPLVVVTTTSTVPVPGGAVAVISVAESTVNDAAWVLPNATPAVPVKPEPVMSTLVPPDGTPPAGETPVTTGSGASVTPGLMSQAAATVAGSTVRTFAGMLATAAM